MLNLIHTQACAVFFFKSFLLVGKTELAKQVARYLHKDNKKVHV